MRIKCNEREAQFAVKSAEEWIRRTVGQTPMWWNINTGLVSSEFIANIEATFERDLPPVPDGKEYEYKWGKDCSGEKPEGTKHYWYVAPGWFESLRGSRYDQDCIYAIPIKKESCVVDGKVDYIAGRGCVIPTDMGYGAEVLIIPKDRVADDYSNYGRRHIVVREDK